MSSCPKRGCFCVGVLLMGWGSSHADTLLLCRRLSCRVVVVHSALTSVHRWRSKAGLPPPHFRLPVGASSPPHLSLSSFLKISCVCQAAGGGWQADAAGCDRQKRPPAMVSSKRRAPRPTPGRSPPSAHPTSAEFEQKGLPHLLPLLLLVESPPQAEGACGAAAGKGREE